MRLHVRLNKGTIIKSHFAITRNLSFWSNLSLNARNTDKRSYNFNVDPVTFTTGKCTHPIRSRIQYSLDLICNNSSYLIIESCDTKFVFCHMQNCIADLIIDFFIIL